MRLQVSQNYYVRDKPLRWIPAEKARQVCIEGYENLDFFLHYAQGEGWCVTDALTGMRVGGKGYKSHQQTIDAAKKIMDKMGKEKVIQEITEAVQKQGLSPRYIIVF